MLGLALGLAAVWGGSQVTERGPLPCHLPSSKRQGQPLGSPPPPTHCPPSPAIPTFARGSLSPTNHPSERATHRKED